MSAALQICHTAFDSVFFTLPAEVQKRIEHKVDAMGLRLATFPHHRMVGSTRYRLRVGDYRVIYSLDVPKNEIHLLALGHRREIYRD